jgi:hypothetical protein
MQTGAVDARIGRFTLTLHRRPARTGRSRATFLGRLLGGAGFAVAGRSAADARALSA